MKRLEGKAAIITGAGTGIGEAIAHKFVVEGARVLLNGLPGDPVGEVAERIKRSYEGAEALVYLGDVAEEEEAKACVQAAVDAFGKLDVLVNNAGVLSHLDETQDYPVEEFDRMIRNNTRTVFLMTKYALPHLQKTHGNIVSAGSEAGFNGTPKFSPYGGTKAWVHAFMKGVAVEQAQYNVRANCVCPGPIDTAWTHRETGPFDKETEKTMLSAVPFGRLGTTEEMANVYAFLASDEASFVTGALWLADGGITVAHGPIGLQAGKEAKRPPEGKLRLEHQREGLETMPKAQPVSS